jgi:hypothetical protein
MMGGGFGVELILIQDSAIASYTDFVLEDTEPMFKNVNDTGYKREITVPVQKLKLTLKNKKYKVGDEVYGYVEGETNTYFEKDSYEPGHLLTKKFKGYFKCKLILAKDKNK